MDLIAEVITTLSSWIRLYLYEIGLSMTATLLVIYGQDITYFIKRQISGLSYFVRLTLFILVCAFGFAFLTSFLTPLIISFFAGISDLWLGLIVILSFYLIGFLAQKKNLF